MPRRRVLWCSNKFTAYPTELQTAECAPGYGYNGKGSSQINYPYPKCKLCGENMYTHGGNPKCHTAVADVAVPNTNGVGVHCLPGYKGTPTYDESGQYRPKSC